MHWVAGSRVVLYVSLDLGFLLVYSVLKEFIQWDDVDFKGIHSTPSG